MKKIIRRILISLALTFRWKSKKWADLFFEDMRERVDDICSRIDLDVKDIKIINKDKQFAVCSGGGKKPRHTYLTLCANGTSQVFALQVKPCPLQLANYLSSLTGALVLRTTTRASIRE